MLAYKAIHINLMSDLTNFTEQNSTHNLGALPGRPKSYVKVPVTPIAGVTTMSGVTGSLGIEQTRMPEQAPAKTLVWIALLLNPHP